MSLNTAKYKIYPSLLDKYQSLLNYEQEADMPWNKVSERAAAENRYEGKEAGDYILTPDEMYDKLEAELLATINREPQEISQAADRGTALNEIIDCMLLNRKTTKEGMVITTQSCEGEPFAIRADYDGFSFNFDVTLCRELKQMLQGSICQYFAKAILPTKHGDCELYGYLDYWRYGDIIDLKTTSKYDFGKYERKWQRYAYPYMCIASGMTKEVDNFTFLAVQLKESAVITGTIYPETYNYNHEQAIKLLQEHVEGFIDFIESHREQITDKKIFNNE
jgi:hypothetical protein